MRLVERKHPTWTVERIQEYLHRNESNHAMNEELSQIQDLGDESRKMFKKRVDREQARQRRAAAAEQGAASWKSFTVVGKKVETTRIMSFILEATSPDPDAEAEEIVLGAHVKVKLPNGLVRSYSIVSGNRNKFELGIALGEKSKGGSLFFHREAQIGTAVQVGRITKDVKAAGMASNHVFIVGGVGITAFLAMMQVYHRIHFNFSLHYAIRDGAEVPFRDRLDELGGSVRMYPGSAGKRMDIRSIVNNMGWNSQLYVCGPPRMMEAARQAVEACGVEDVHYEAFEAETGGDPFEAMVRNRGGKSLEVGAEETLLDVLKREFGDGVASSCEVGNCGTCRVPLMAGEVLHRGSALTAEERVGSMLSCVSRGIGRIEIEI
jgi:ferredoxin-NADP reductase